MGPMVVTEIEPYDTVGHIDMLFDSTRAPAPKALMAQIEQLREAKLAQLQADVDAMAGGPPPKAEEAGDEMAAAVDEDEDEDDEESIDPDFLPRCVQNKMFITYSMTSSCELLILKRDDFNRLLYQCAFDDLTRRIGIVEGCRCVRVFPSHSLFD